jgi:ABC-type nitrate/sulfonate/bicarbonate transport system substrate-binding protein
VIIAQAQGMFQKAGVDVVTLPFLLGKDALKSVLDGNADLAVVADTPFMFALLDGKDVVMVAGISQARRSLAIVARTDRGIGSLTDLGGKSVALTMGTNFPYFLDAMLQTYKVPSESVRRVDLKPHDILAAVKEGEVDAAVLFQPLLAQLQADMGNRITTFFGEDVYAFRFLLVGKPAYIDQHPQEVARILGALAAANQSIRNDPLAARKAVGALVKVDDAIMAKLFEPEDYVLSLDQAMLLALDDQTRWAMKQGLVKNGPVPNYLNAMKFKSLEAVLPNAVKIAH